MTRNDVLWEKIVEKHSIDLSAPLTVLTEDQIKSALEGSRRDLRNATSMTSVKQWAKVLKEAGVFVLPKSRTEWMLVHGRGYYEGLKDPGNAEDFPSRQTIPLTTLAYGKGENGYLNHAYHSGLLGQFTGVSTIFETLSGRSGTTAFQFDVDGTRGLTVSHGTQMDVDKGFEGANEVLLFEAKVGQQNNFLIRQLYYPFRSHVDFQGQTGRKKVRPFLFVADPKAETFTLWEFTWKPSSLLDYEAIEPVGEPRRFRIVEQTVPEDRFTEIARDRSIPEIQANDLNKVTSLPFLIPQGIDNAKKWVEYQGWHSGPRQGNYYGAAAASLGLIRSEDGTFVLTDLGKTFVTLSPPKRDEMTAERLLKVPTINRVFLMAQDRAADGVGPNDVARIITETQALTGTTPRRRASTVLAWFKWFGLTTGTIVVDGQRIYSKAGWEKRGLT